MPDGAQDAARAAFARNLRRIASDKGVTQADIALATACSSATVSDWFNGKKYPRPNRMQRIADTLGVYISDLIKSDNEPLSTLSTKKTGVLIPVLGRVQAGIPVEAVEEVLDYEEITPQMAATGEFFALRIRGQSMEPRMLDGDVVIVRQQNDINSGEVGVFLVNGDEATVKKARKQDDGILLIPYNSDFDSMFYSNDAIEQLPVRVIGKVVELRGKF
jgi:repressor LexA